MYECCTTQDIVKMLSISTASHLRLTLAASVTTLGWLELI
jgi:hypothetical protein